MIKHVDDLPLSKVFDTDLPSFFVVPKYQREYVWGQSDWDALFDDLADNESNDGHFLGTFLAVNRQNASHIAPRYDVIDGQQRLTTLSLLLAAIYRVISRDISQDEEAIVERMLLRKMLVTGDAARLSPQESGSNRDDYFAVLHNAGLPLTPKPKTPKWMGNRRIERAFRHFGRLLGAHGQRNAKDDLWAARDMLGRVKRAVLVKLEVGTYSDAFKLFESLNNRGKPLTPIDLIKNSLLARAEATEGVTLDGVYDDWTTWLDRLGDDYSTQERFFRQFYNAMKDVWGLSIAGAPVATRSNLIRIYEEQIEKRLVDSDELHHPGLLTGLDLATEQYERLITLAPDAWETSELNRALADLVRSEGTTAQVLMLYLLLKQSERRLTDSDLLKLTRLLVAFSVRRNMTNQPPTYELQRLFMEVIHDLERLDSTGEQVYDVVLRRLSARSADDVDFARSLGGPIYEDHTNVARFILVQLAKQSMTKESWQDLWARDQNQSGTATYRWTIEHVLPQTEHLGKDWVEMLGGATAASATQLAHVHELGNLTITGFNASLGKKSFIDKRDRVDEAGHPIGYLNGLNLNSDLAARDTWNEDALTRRTATLIGKVIAAFPLA
ncbi:DUF262 domain-containing protein [Microbacterium sp. 3J1]|uniref:DUF262 domain-containing protein n=1 Tax=Microbacterium sp. 3J1 TaxID=861269 RepID=UPI00159EF249|nr:DUF262 domain-containing protein [Microbacterium sp. 3J1]